MNKIIFVYNADSGILNSIKDLAHKIVSPKTYPCNLCMVTYGNFGMKNEWKEFVSAFDTEFLHKDEFLQKYDIKNADFPCAFIEKKDGLKLFISRNEINNCKNLDELIELVKEKFKKLRQTNE